jgi:hypothetical protein
MKPIIRHWTAIVSLLISAHSLANSSGAPVCSVPFIPFTPMSNVLANPAPQGWRLQTAAKFYQPSVAIEFRVVNTDPLRKVLGVLIWAQLEDFTTPAGSFLIGPGTPWKYVSPAPGVQCQQGSVTHNSPVPKTQAELVFSWTPPAEGNVHVQAFVIEECGGGCRSYQALTQTIDLVEAIHIDGFE